MGSVCWSLSTCTLLVYHPIYNKSVAMKSPPISTVVFLSATVLSSPFPQNVLTLSEFRSSAARNLDLGKPHGVIISPSYSKIRRQGRKGDPDPFADILAKAGVSSETTTLLITTKIYDDEETTFDENIIYYNDDENDEYDNASEEKHVIVFVKSSDADQVPSVSDLQFELESVIQQNLSVYINEDPSVVQRSLNQYKHVIFVDATVESPHISGNVFSDNKPLEVLE